jgi:hypothetical protein
VIDHTAHHHALNNVLSAVQNRTFGIMSAAIQVTINTKSRQVICMLNKDVKGLSAPFQTSNAGKYWQSEKGQLSHSLSIPSKKAAEFRLNDNGEIEREKSYRLKINNLLTYDQKQTKGVF